ncbi:acyl-CoA ligase (AMP-forming), exosortase A system-associated [Hydrogenophaga sp. PBL-H3]|uniref:acyl-CoA ligase (AMP-forming), exosortase A system-associated n=1 Tax=Hydrogenophaga sp. PBL-H3 TaxID=434010 RepID=UPI0013205173|nr:acyl-CoA ligase (AMP-forming), exosortase A system-associated [Hydrogenophaga sp. PBL-H3]QHE76690.1 acyl-CoA ligase (AMP-forming), exosortase A system-associated [Hydrogenophaga sp. PBL-H3]QHE81114.1 acyl-CoA ligase (AMP-forming), exosortase A system-associated [Hydrogenophaga sp. PBL-H3]
MRRMATAQDFSESYPPVLLHELPLRAAAEMQQRLALTAGRTSVSYGELGESIQGLAAGLIQLGLVRGERVAVFLEKRVEAVVTSFGVSAACGVLVPVNPLLKPAQVAHILQDAGVQVLVTSASRLEVLKPALKECLALRHVVVCDNAAALTAELPCKLHAWADVLACRQNVLPSVLETDAAAIFYTSGSTGLPKGVVLSHRNLVAGATSVASYLQNNADDTLLAALPLSFDAGFSQLTTAFLVGARVVLLNHLLPRDVLLAMAREQVTGLTAVPALYMQLAALDWPEEASRHLRYWACTGGRMPRATLDRLRQLMPSTKPFLMYGLTEAFRSTYLPPSEVDRRPDSIGKAIPNVEIRVLRPDGTECDVDEPGELVHRGPLVALGYWRRPEETALRFRAWPIALSTPREAFARTEMTVFSGDTVRRDAEGFLYFVARHDEMIKTSGYRVSPTEVEEAVHASGLVVEALAVGMPHAVLGQVIVVAAVAISDEDTGALLAHCKATLPAYMVPAVVHWHDQALPRNPNGKLDRARWKSDWERLAGKNNDETL